ncbi:sigma-70 family RNA polymerase sigma factor [Proteiniclasticum sp. SCR006]|uniref:Sigma-70 family RNA polymerase sigma factor n=1 Tax=Proteiniclasticum aestuarii TaxID=2817862 RepID=A0A939HAM1_9CLOT|nr:sigma-70 family RNA polymerase sigma factor [Proteiniclasticum aestuarii]MBO1264457.1 sigma-70 family RNA polymerase sigma factor [Proteiniclasticum aestuarii]
MDQFDFYKLNISDVLVDDPEISNEQLMIEYLDGDDAAREKLILRNTGLVRMIVNQYNPPGSIGSLDEDLMQEGMIGLIQAIEKYDPYLSNASRFSSYAVIWIKATISKYQRNKASMIRVPSYKYDDYQKLKSIIKTIEGKINREPKMFEISKEAKMDIDKVQNLIVLFSKIDSLDRPISSDDDSFTIGDLILDYDDAYLEVELIAYNDWLRDEINKGLNKHLTLLENNVVRLRYGLDDYNEMQLNQISEILDLTVNQVYTILLNAFTKLRKSSWYVRMKIQCDY